MFFKFVRDSSIGAIFAGALVVSDAIVDRIAHVKGQHQSVSLVIIAVSVTPILGSFFGYYRSTKLNILAICLGWLAVGIACAIVSREWVRASAGLLVSAFAVAALFLASRRA